MLTIHYPSLAGLGLLADYFNVSKRVCNVSFTITQNVGVGLQVTKPQIKWFICKPSELLQNYFINIYDSFVFN